MSDIVKARQVIEVAQIMLETAMGLMTREPPARKKAAPRSVKITDAVRTQVKALVEQGKTNHQIAEIVGLRNGGRVSDILHGKR